MLQPGGTPTKIVCLTQVVTADDLGDDEEYEDIMEDMRQEGGKFGKQCYCHLLTVTLSKLLVIQIHCCVQVTW